MYRYSYIARFSLVTATSIFLSVRDNSIQSTKFDTRDRNFISPTLISRRKDWRRLFFRDTISYTARSTNNSWVLSARNDLSLANLARRSSVSFLAASVASYVKWNSTSVCTSNEPKPITIRHATEAYPSVFRRGITGWSTQRIIFRLIPAVIALHYDSECYRDLSSLFFCYIAL